ncbi:hypothetical protein EMIT0194P_250031 [Pseudomonas serbica]
MGYLFGYPIPKQALSFDEFF